jgi:polyisoprenyl-phosphate glycosyltransferase
MSNLAPEQSVKNKVTPIFLLTAVRNEAALIGLFLSEIHEVFSKAEMLSRVWLVIVDDYSTDNTTQVIAECASRMSDLRVEVISLGSNRGNQSAMAYGLRQIAPRVKDACLLTFDADGEDDLARLPELVRMLDRDSSRMVFVYREGRKDAVLIRIFYSIYRVVYRLLTGQKLIPCNMMAMPGHMVPAIVESPFIALHFSYPPLRLRLPYQAVPMARRERYGGASSQNISLLVQHALIGLTIFYEQVVARLMLLTAGVVAVTAVLSIIVVAVRFARPHLLPVGFSTLVFLSLFGFGFVSVVLLVVFCLACSIFRMLVEQGREG